MPEIYDADGNELGLISLTERQQAVLDAGGSIDVLYHTPQLMRTVFGTRSGVFSLHQDGDRLLTSTPAAVKDYAQLRAAVAAAKARESA